MINDIPKRRKKTTHRICHPKKLFNKLKEKVNRFIDFTSTSIYGSILSHFFPLFSLVFLISQIDIIENISV